MIVCPNCNHQNPEGAVQCEACYTPLPALAECPNCGASVQSDASFCGQCGFNLNGVTNKAPLGGVTASPAISDLLPADPLVAPEPLVAQAEAPLASVTAQEETPVAEPMAVPPLASAAYPAGAQAGSTPLANSAEASEATEGRTKLQQQMVSLLHVQTNTSVELPQKLTVIHIGKPNDRIPPDIDVSGFPNSEIVSRIHANIRIEGDSYFIEDVGSSNGTYINNLPLAMGNRHRLRSGDRIALGKGDKVTFIFQLSLA